MSRTITYACPVCAASMIEASDALAQTAFSIADDASRSLIETEFQRNDHVTYSIEADTVAGSEILEEAISYLVARGLARRYDAGDMVQVILETDE